MTDYTRCKNRNVDLAYIQRKDRYVTCPICSEEIFVGTEKIYRKGNLIIDKNAAFYDACLNGNLNFAKRLYNSGGVEVHDEYDIIFRCCCRFEQIHVLRWLYSLGGINKKFLKFLWSNDILHYRWNDGYGTLALYEKIFSSE